MEIFAKKLSDKPVVDSNGSVIGQLHNVTIDFKSGELRNLLVTPEGNSAQQQRHISKYTSDDHGRHMIPVNSVSAVKDQIIVQ
jgi:sporulation protein YlmC with PRC-barrel domain